MDFFFSCARSMHMYFLVDLKVYFDRMMFKFKYLAILFCSIKLFLTMYSFHFILYLVGSQYFKGQEQQIILDSHQVLKLKKKICCFNTHVCRIKNLVYIFHIVANYFVSYNFV